MLATTSPYHVVDINDPTRIPKTMTKTCSEVGLSMQLYSKCHELKLVFVSMKGAYIKLAYT